MAKVIVRIRGGLGNQLFCYAAGRRLALVNDAELVLDHVTGFVRDYRYRRQYELDRFRITARKATPAERMEPFERCRRGLAKLIARKRPFHRRRYIEQEGIDFEPRLLSTKVTETVYLDGLWQGQGYFEDIEQTIREDFRITPPIDVKNRSLADEMDRCEAVAVHMRWHDSPGRQSTPNNMGRGYFERALYEADRRLRRPHYFLFSGQPEASKEIVDFAGRRVTYVNHNRGRENAYADLWLMTRCKHFIIANSTFSWWGAWLAEHRDKTIIAPAITQYSGLCGWGFKGLIPPEWILL